MDLSKSASNVNNKINLETSNDGTSSSWSEIDESFLQDLEQPFDPDNANSSKLRTDEQYEGFDNNAGGQYIYPINLPIRSYQYNIVKASLFQNTLIVLPTGLGKTFIAAVVMYNIYRWYPTGKVIFMAPTRPLVSQQIEACSKIMGIPIDDTAEMTGKQIKDKRIELWNNKRIFFATPQTVRIDINDPEVNFPFNRIKLIVIDEAHKAQGRYAYTDVVQTLNNRNPYFRIIALSATPGRRIEDAMEIIQNLCISHVEVRSENSIDVLPFTFRKNIKTVLVPLGEKLTIIRDDLINIIDPYVRNLIDNGVLNGNTGNFTKSWLVMEQKKFREMSIHQRHPKHSDVSRDFSICISLYHALELLERHGLRVFLNFFDISDSENQQEKFYVQCNVKLRDFLNKLRQDIGPNPFAISDQTMTNGKIRDIPDNLDFGHPKFEMVRRFLADHFQTHKESKVIVFCEFRESVMLLHRLLLQNRPLILPKVFVGQGGTGSIRAVSQKEQKQAMDDFRNGIVNTLIATSVAEEGIDVGEVNLIVCFDISSKNPTRFVQRIGRTGRKQQGQVIILATEGKEHSLVKEVLVARDEVNQKLSKSRSLKHKLYQRSPRIIPPEFNPKCLEVFMKVQLTKPIQDNKKSSKNSKKIKNLDDNKKPSKPRKRKESGPPSEDVRNFFKKTELDKEDIEIFCTNEKQSNNIIQDNDLINVDNLIKNFSPVTQIEKLNTLSVPSQVQPSEDVRNFFKKTELDKEDIEIVCSNEKQSNNIIQDNDLINVDSTDIELNFRKLNQLASKLNLPDYSNIIETIQSKNIDKNVKKFILQNNIEFVREKFEAMQIILIINNNEIENLSVVDDSEKKLRLIYSSIAEILGDKYAIEKFIHENTANNLEKKNNIKKLDEKFADFFEEFEERDFSDSVEGFITQKLDEIDLNLLEPSQEEVEVVTSYDNSSLIYENLLESEIGASISNYEFDLDFENESKYADQWSQFDNQLTNQSTPISKKLNKNNSKILVDSPLATSFKNGINRKSLPTIPENMLVENESKIKNLNISSLTEKANILKTDRHTTEQSKDTLNNNLCKKYEISVDLFDDDFDEILASHEILNSNENNCTNIKVTVPTIIKSAKEEINRTNVISNPKNQNCMKPKYSSTIEKYKITESLKESSTKNVKSSAEIAVPDNDYNFNKPKFYHSSGNKNYNRFTKDPLEKSENERTESMSIIEIDKILEIVAEVERTTEKDKHHTTNPELEDFDLNDFLEPFEDENDCKENDFKETPSIITNELSNDIFDITSPNEMLQSKQRSSIENSSKEFTDGAKISPSIIGRRKPNYSQLRHITSKINTISITEIKNMNTEQHLSKMEVEKPLLNISYDVNLVNRKMQNKTAEESIIFRPCRKLKNIIESSESDEENSGENDVCNLSQEIGITPAKTRSIQRLYERKKNRFKNRKNCKFFDDEAVHSGNDSSDDEVLNEIDVLDSIVVMDGEEEEDDPNVNMHAKYLQSIRSPKYIARGAFKIPPQRKFMDLSRIFSQPVKPDDTLNDCSFVVSDEDNVFDGEITEMCPLEQAEAILEDRRKAKRKQKQCDVNVKKRRRIINDLIEISDDE